MSPIYLRRSLRRIRLVAGCYAQLVADESGALIADLGYLFRHRPATGSLSQILCEVIKSLNDPRRSVFIMVRIKELAPSEVAQRLGISRRRVDWHFRSAESSIELRLKLNGVDLGSTPPPLHPKSLYPVSWQATEAVAQAARRRRAA